MLRDFFYFTEKYLFAIGISYYNTITIYGVRNKQCNNYRNEINICKHVRNIGANNFT